MERGAASEDPTASAPLRAAIVAVLQSIAPELDPARIDGARPLRQQIDLDSIDWLNVVLRLREQLAIEIPARDHGKLTSLDAITAYAAAKRARVAAPRARQPRAATAVPAERVHALPDGRRVVVRPIRAEDMPLEIDFFRHLSSESRYKRFMAAIADLPEKKLRYLTDVDYVHHMALVATTTDRGEANRREAKDAGATGGGATSGPAADGPAIEVGLASYVVDPRDAGNCEFAIVIADDWQGSGLAGVMMADLLDTARAAGLERIEGLVLATNQPMIRFARQLGFTIRHDAEDPGTVRVERPL